jgi:hypothetical protein
MSLYEALKEKARDSKDLDSLASLPQTFIIQMGQRKELTPEEVTLIIGKKGQQIEDAAQRRALEQVNQQPMPSVIEQKMMQIAQAENPVPEPQMQPQMQPQMMAQAPMPQLPEDVGIAQNPVPPMQMAGGGIISFSGEDGSYVEDEEDEDDALIYSLLQKMQSGSGRGRDSLSAGIASGYEDRDERSGDMVDRLRAQIMAKESGGRRYDKSGKLLTSSKGAEGEMQVMPYTARDPGFGIRPARDGSPDELRRVGDEYAAAMYSRYGDPKLAMIAYNMGPGATDKWLASGADPRRLPKETQGYIRGVSLAEGGEVKGYAGPEGSVVETEEPSSVFDRLFGGGDRLKEYQDRLARQQEFERVTREQPGFFQKTTSAERNKAEADLAAAEAARRGPRSAKPSGETFVDPNITALQKRKDYDKKIDTSGEGVQNLIAAKKEELTPEQELFNEIRADMKARKAALAEDRKMDKWRAGLAAGAKMMMNTSPYAMVGFGSGVDAGAQSFAESRKLRAAEEAGITSGMGSLYKNQLISKLKDAQISDTKAFRDEKLNFDRSKAAQDAVAKALSSNEAKTKLLRLDSLEALFSRGKLDKAQLTDLETLRAWRAKIENDARRNIMVSGGGGAGYTPTKTQTTALNKYS